MRRYARYKPTGIPWLPEVPDGWEVFLTQRRRDAECAEVLAV